MKLVGSRSTNSADEFSDWDYHVDSTEDFETISAKVAEAIAWTATKRGNLYVVTLLDQDGVMWDYSGAFDQFSERWNTLGTPDAASRPVYEYWIMAFKSLKGMYRGYDEFVALGIEMSTGMVRDIYLQRKYDIGNYKNFFAFAKIAPLLAADSKLTETTGMAYVTVAQKLQKIAALNELVINVSADISPPLNTAYKRFAKLITRS